MDTATTPRYQIILEDQLEEASGAQRRSREPLTSIEPVRTSPAARYGSAGLPSCRGCVKAAAADRGRRRGQFVEAGADEGIELGTDQVGVAGDEFGESFIEAAALRHATLPTSEIFVHYWPRRERRKGIAGAVSEAANNRLDKG